MLKVFTVYYSIHILYATFRDYFQVPNTFSVCTSHRGFLMQTMSNEEVHDWLYAINPLLAGQMKSKSAARKNLVAA